METSREEKPIWQKPPGLLALSPLVVDIWRIKVSGEVGHLARLQALLDEAEAARARQFRMPPDHDRFVVGRGTLRYLISAYTGINPRAVLFRYNPYGKPFLSAEDSRLRFNTSHSGTSVVHAFTLDAPLGVDVEAIRPKIAREGIADTLFAPEEAAALRSLPPDRAVAGFFACWTRKEAYLKGRGWGLGYPLDAFVVSVAPEEPPRLLSGEGAASWRLYDVEAGPGLAGCLAVEGTQHQLRFWDFDLDSFPVAR
jgi:4'-phosphopantetheinyl transferase